ncbi:hypothetical protein [Halovenus halobia]|uniref:hypothetical protein n=1 Tax=Halovenus halobia TaxID=3396622 RepID=UPI003F55614F
MTGEALFAVAERALFERSENISVSVTRERAEGVCVFLPAFVPPGKSRGSVSFLVLAQHFSQSYNHPAGDSTFR